MFVFLAHEGTVHEDEISATVHNLPEILLITVAVIIISVTVFVLLKNTPVTQEEEVDK